ncbi:unnamed protein product [Onchocerca ochengi]|uniref:Uncharacterized protein n=1 Tax=Onchocerca ochengi TaxID=42157 RepID=A0A182E3Q2_ONCOC|nr:unnamed protein product [Onchocerca ochengi]
MPRSAASTASKIDTDDNNDSAVAATTITAADAVAATIVDSDDGIANDDCDDTDYDDDADADDDDDDYGDTDDNGNCSGSVGDGDGGGGGCGGGDDTNRECLVIGMAQRVFALSVLSSFAFLILTFDVVRSDCYATAENSRSDNFVTSLSIVYFHHFENGTINDRQIGKRQEQSQKYIIIIIIIIPSPAAVIEVASIRAETNQ